MEQTLSADAALGIVAHMNDDHADAVAGYARVFANVPDVRAARIVALDGQSMELAVETASEQIRTNIAFDHVLVDASDARDTLIAMARRAPAV